MTWGIGSWGFTPWGGSEGGDFELVSATTVRENLVRLAFTLPVRLRGDLAPRDAGHLRKYSIAADTTTTGSDGLVARAVLPCKVELALVENAGGALVDLWVDRPLSPYPAIYSVAVTEIYGDAGELLAPGETMALFLGMRAAPPRLALDLAAHAKDFANPQFPGSLVNAVATPGAIPGSFVADATGDYGTDDGSTSYRKRIVRRLLTRKGRFAHLPEYGVDIPGHVKELAKPSVRTAFTSSAEEQIAQEPETESVQVALVPMGGGVFKLQVRARTRAGQQVDLEEQIFAGA